MDQINYHQMLKKYDLKPKRDNKVDDSKKQKNLKISAKNYTSQLQKSKRVERPMSKGTAKIVKVNASIVYEASQKWVEPEVVREGNYSMHELQVMLVLELPQEEEIFV